MRHPAGWRGRLPALSPRFLDLGGLILVIFVASATRLAFALRPPPFLTPDSQGYYLPGWEVAHSLGFSPELRRTPLYPLFLALVVFILGEDLRAATSVQHLLGVLSAGASFALGRVAFGRLAGLSAGLLVALAGPLLIYEHYLLTESLFACLLTIAMLAALLALRQPSRSRLVAAGVALAAAALTRPVADVLIPLLPLAVLLRLRSWRAALSSTAWFAVGLGLLMLPWMLRNTLTHGTFSAEGALGQALIGRTVRHDDYRKFYTCPPLETDPLKASALRIICEEAGGEPSGGVITQRMRDELGLSQAQTSNLLRQVAFEAIARRPDHYISGTAKMTGEILLGKRETVIAAWRERTTRNWDHKWDPRLTPLVTSPPPAEGPEYERADAVASLFQPFRWRRELSALIVIGLLATILRPGWRLGLIIPLAAGAIVLASAALDGLVWRYRYPVDPLLATVAGAGCEALVLAALWSVARFRRHPQAAARPPVASSGGAIEPERWSERTPAVERRA